MSEYNKTKEEYVEDFARTYCHDDIEEAKETELVKEVCKELKREEE